MRQDRRIAAVGVAVAISVAVVSGANSDLQLIEAVRSQDHQAVQLLLDKGVDVNVPEGDGATALHWAVERNDAPLVDALVQAGAAPT